MELGKTLIFLGLSVFVLGVFVYFIGDKLSWFGNLFGDLSYRGDGFHVYAPFMSMIVISIVLTLVINIALRIFK